MPGRTRWRPAGDRCPCARATSASRGRRWKSEPRAAPARRLLEGLSFTEVIAPGRRVFRPFSTRAAFEPCKKRSPVAAMAVFLPLVALVVLLAGAGCEMSSARAMTVPTPDSFTVVALPDTQYYAAAHPQLLAAQADWILRRSHADHPRQWRAAARCLHQLDGVGPWVLSAGNHDYRRNGSVISRASEINTYFPPADFARNGRIGGTFETGRIEN